MNCKQLGGVCDLEFHANSFNEMAEMIRKHGMDMFRAKDEAHLRAMNEMRALMNSPEEMKSWFDKKRREFELLPED